MITAVLVLGLGGGCAVAAVRLLHRATAVSPTALERVPFLSGSRPEEHALSRFHARFYPLTLLFLAFDVEMLYMYPWAVVVGRVGPSAIVEMFVMLGVLVLGVVWARREGALEWA